MRKVRNYSKRFLIGFVIIFVGLVVGFALEAAGVTTKSVTMTIFVLALGIGGAIQISAFIMAHQDFKRATKQYKEFKSSIKRPDARTDRLLSMAEEPCFETLKGFLLKEEWAIYKVSGEKRQFFGDTAFGPMWKDLPKGMEVPSDLELTSLKEVKEYLDEN